MPCRQSCPTTWHVGDKRNMTLLPSNKTRQNRCSIIVTQDPLHIFQVTISTKLVPSRPPQAWLSVHSRQTAIHTPPPQVGFPAVVPANAYAPLRPPQQPRPYQNQAEISIFNLTAPLEGLQLSPNVLEHLRWWGNPVVLHPMLCCNTALRSTHDARAESSFPKQHQLHSAEEQAS